MAEERILEAVTPTKQLHQILPIEEAPAKPAGEFAAQTSPPLQIHDDVFVEEADSASAAGLIGLWAGTLILHDLAVDHLRGPASEEDEDEPKPKPKPRKDHDEE
jgi:hypothetical protein